MAQDLEQQIKNVMSDILDISADSISEETKMEDIEAWDSANHIQLIIALEEAFSISFEVNEIEMMLSYSDILDIVQSK